MDFINFVDLFIFIVFCICVICGLIYYNECFKEQQFKTKIYKLKYEREVIKNGRFKFNK